MPFEVFTRLWVVPFCCFLSSSKKVIFLLCGISLWLSLYLNRCVAPIKVDFLRFSVLFSLLITYLLLMYIFMS